MDLFSSFTDRIYAIDWRGIYNTVVIVISIIQADALLDDVLMHLGYEGDTMGDRLKIIDPVQLPSADRVWSAHRLRNTIVHDPMVEHTRETVINALRAYQDAFRELGVLKEEM